MNIFDLNSKLEANQRVIEALNAIGTKDYLLMLSGGNSLTDLYKHISTSFNFPFPKHVAMVDEVWGASNQHRDSHELLLKDSGIIGRVMWEKSEFHSILSANLSNPKVEASGYESELLELMQLYAGKVVSIMSMGEDGSTAGIFPHTEPVVSNKYFIAYEHAEHQKIRLTATVQCIGQYFSKNFVILNTEAKSGLMHRLNDFESDFNEYPALVYKGNEESSIFCYKDS